MPDPEPTPPSALRRDRKAQAATGLVPATVVRSSRVVAATSTGRGWLVGAGLAVAIIVAFSATMLATAGSEDTVSPMRSESQDLRAVDHLMAPCALPAAGEASGAVSELDICDEADEADEAGDFPEPRTESERPDARPDAQPDPHASGQPITPVTPNAPTPATQTQEAPTAPQTNAPEPSNPSPEPTPLPSRPAPAPEPPPSAPPPPAPAPKPLAFTGLEAHGVLGLLLSSYTLSLSGEPGSTATVWYGSSRAGSVTFNSGGRASIRIGSSLINLGLTNPIIRAEYSDGTSGDSVQARRDSI